MRKSVYVVVATGLDDHRLHSGQFDNVDPWSGTSEMAFVANTKGTSKLSFAEMRTHPYFCLKIPPLENLQGQLGKP